MALTALAGFFHFVRVGPNEIDERDEAAAQQALDAPQQRTAPPSAGADKRP
jgi:formate dehydrogenase iron-sulfur subunit